MSDRRRLTLWLVALLLIGMNGSTPGQQRLQSGPGTNVKLERSGGPPDGRATVRVTLALAPGAKVGELNLTISFPKDELSYVDLETGGVTDAAEADVKAEVKASDSDRTASQLSLKISTLTGKATRKPLLDGAIAYLIFKIAKDVKLNTNIRFDVSGTAVSPDDPPKPVQPLTVQAAQLLISREPITGCFFYMH